MSLINDALKRAKDAQQKSPPPAAEMQLRPVTAATAPTSGVGMIVPLVAAVGAVTVLLLVWQGRQKTAAREVTVAPKPRTPMVVMPVAKPVVQSAPVVAGIIPVTTVAVAEPKPMIAPAPALVTSVPVMPMPVMALKLQAISYSPGHSWAIISGKTVTVGTVFKGFRVAALTEVSATLVSATQTNVMTLEQ